MNYGFRFYIINSIVIYILISYVIPLCLLHIYLEMFISLDSNSIITSLSYIIDLLLLMSQLQASWTCVRTYYECVYLYHYNQHFLSIEYLLHSASYVSLIVYLFIKCTACTTFIKKIGKVDKKTYLSDDHIIYIFIEPKMFKLNIDYINRYNYYTTISISVVVGNLRVLV